MKTLNFRPLTKKLRQENATKLQFVAALTMNKVFCVMLFQ